MSELEIRQRQEYKRKRKKWMLVQLIAIAVLLAIALTSFLIYNRIDQTQYIQYTQKGDAAYQVQYVPNDFFESEWIGQGQSYISSLIAAVKADFSYEMKVDAARMDMDYTYFIDAKLSVTRSSDGKTYYSVEERLLPMANAYERDASAVRVNETLSVDYGRFDAIARSFIKAYNLKDATSMLSVTLTVQTSCSSRSFSDSCKTVYTTALNIPMAQDTFAIYSTASVPSGEVGTFAYEGAVNRALFLDTFIVALVLATVLLAVLLAFLHLTKNEDVTYAARVRKILRSYGSFVQRIYGEFAFDEYQTVMVKSFTEMLGIRDTIQSPVLMLENRDETMTRFLIPTNTKLLYVFEIKVDNYDEIYARIRATEPPVEAEPFYEEVLQAVEEAAAEAAVLYGESAADGTDAAAEAAETAEAADAPEAQVLGEDVLAHLVDEGDAAGASELSYVDDAGRRIAIPCKRGFTANLIQSNPQVKAYYNELKNAILSYKGVKSRISWRQESFSKGRLSLFKLKIRGKTICLYCALDPSLYERSKYFHEHVEAKAFADVPMLVRIRSDRGLKRACGLIEQVMQRFAVPALPVPTVQDYAAAYPYETTKQLVARGLIKILLPGAVAAEPYYVQTLSPAEEITVQTVSVSEPPLEDTADTDAPEAQALGEDVLAHLVDEGDAAGASELSYVDDAGRRIAIPCKRGFTANLIQSNPQVKAYYNELKNAILSYKGVKSRISWRQESFSKGRLSLFKLKIRGKTICLYCALDPSLYERSKYFHEHVEAKAFADVPMLVRIRSDRGLKRACGLIEQVMQRFAVPALPVPTVQDYAAAYPYETTKQLVARGLIKILLPGAVAAEPKPHHHAHKELSEKPRSKTKTGAKN